MPDTSAGILLSDRAMKRTLLLALLSLPAPAFACGGFFCSALSLEPVQQSGERILFEVHGDGTITTTVEITYTGTADDFSWVVPVPAVPTLDVETPPDTLALLDDATRPLITPPPTRCSVPGQIFGGVAMRGGGGMAPTMADDSESNGGVEVIDLPQVGPYAAQVVESDDPAALITWLNDNRYLITPEMEPMVAHYVAQEMKFLAVRLAPEADVGAITPLGMTYAATEPMIPIQLTAVGAEPEMGVMAFIVSDQGRWESSNYTNFEVDPDFVQFDPRTGAENYYPLVSWLVDEAGGKGMVTQFAGDLAPVADTAVNNWSWNPDYETSVAYVQDLGAHFGQVSRLYTRISAVEMTEDPSFQVGTGSEVGRTFDLSSRPEVEVCAPETRARRRTIECGTVYCGADAECGVTKDGVAGCICPSGTAAHEIFEARVGSATNVATVVCEDTAFDVFATVAELGVGGEDPCADNVCGANGACVAVNGFPTCTCDEGYAAVPTGAGATCERAVRSYAPDRLLWDAVGCGCGQSGRPAAWSLLALLPLLRRRRR